MPGNINFTASSSREGFVVKLAADDGSVRWAKTIDATTTVDLTGVAFDELGDIYVGGNYEGDIKIGQGIIQTSSGSDVIIVRYTANGSLLKMMFPLDQNGDESINDIIIGTGNQLVIAADTEASGGVLIGITLPQMGNGQRAMDRDRLRQALLRPRRRTCWPGRRWNKRRER